MLGMQMGRGFVSLEDSYSMLGAAKASADVARIQRALAALAAATRDGRLSVKADGVTGPATAAAVNRAFTTHIGAGQAPAAYRTGKLTPAVIADVAHASSIASLIEAEARRRGAAPAARAVAPARPAPKPPAARPAPRAVAPKTTPKTGAKPKATPNAAVTKMQHALNSLAQVAGDSSLTIKVDGLMGPKTAAAVNRALVKHLPAAPAEARTGNLSQAMIVAAASELTATIEDEISRRMKKAPPAVATPKKAVPVRSSAVQSLQNAVVALGRTVNDSSLSSLKADGLMGPKTAAAVNKSLSKYATRAAPMLRSGTLTEAAIVASAASILDALMYESDRRASVPKVKITKPLPTAAPRAGRAAPAPRPAPEEPDEEDVPRIRITKPIPDGGPPVAPAEQPQFPVPSMPPASVPAPQAPAPQADVTVTPPTEEKKPFPWLLAGGIAAGLGLVVTTTILIARRKKRR